MNTPHALRRTAALVLVLFGAGAPAWAQATPAPGAAPPAEKPLLSGPTVPEGASKPTLVERDFTGKVKRLEMAPAEAAVKLVELDEPTRKLVDGILLERSIALDKIVRENILLLANLSNAFQSGNKADQRDLLKELYDKSEPLRARGQLMEEFATVLPGAKLSEVTSLVMEYWQAVLQEPRSEMDAPAEGRKPARRAEGGAGQASAVRAEALAIVGRELRRSYDRVVTAGVKELDELIKRLGLSPEQEAEVRRLTQDYFQKTAGKASAAQKSELFIKIYKLLNTEQRTELLKALDLKRGK